MRRYLRLYPAFVAQRFRVLLEYRGNFIIGILSTLFLQAAGIAGVWVVLRQVPRLAGWTFEELLLVYGLLITSRSLEHMLADNLWTIGRLIREGNFDRYLVRPIDPLFHLLADRFQHDGIGSLAAGVVAIVHAWIRLGIPASPGRVLYAVVAVISGGVIFIALNLMTATTAFWTLESMPLTRSVHELHELAKYPLTVYDRAVRVALTWVVPFAFASFYPASLLLGRDASWLPWLGPTVAAAFAVAAYRLWTFGLRHYTGTGS